MERHTPIPGEFYRHFKDKLYQIRTIAEHSETGETLVIYQALYGDYRTYARPLADFMSPVDHVKYPESKDTWRFTQVDLTQGCVTEVKNSTVHSDDQSQSTESAAPNRVAGTAPADSTPEDLFMDFLDAYAYKKKLEILSQLRGKMTRSMTDSIAASLDLVLPGKSIESDLELIEDHIRTRAKFEVRR